MSVGRVIVISIAIAIALGIVSIYMPKTIIAGSTSVQELVMAFAAIAAGVGVLAALTLLREV